jgi:hypothetical protein
MNITVTVEKKAASRQATAAGDEIEKGQALPARCGVPAPGESSCASCESREGKQGKK